MSEGKTRLTDLSDRELFRLYKETDGLLIRSAHSQARKNVGMGIPSRRAVAGDPKLARKLRHIRAEFERRARRGELMALAGEVLTEDLRRRQTIERQSLARRIGQKINRLRKECGWSFDQLVEKTGIDKKLVLSHVNKGTRPTPRILKEYAEAFSKELERRITAPDLEA